MAKKTKPNTFHIVGIGGSAGAIEAVMDLVGYLPSHTGMAFIYLQHQLPAVESRLASVLAKKAKIPVLEAEDQMAVEPDFFYIVPPGKEMVLSDGAFSIANRPAEGYDYLPINRLFYSLAENYKEYAIGVVLSGADGDGAQGVKAIKFNGGLTFAQDKTARFPSMPETAISEGAVDL